MKSLVALSAALAVMVTGAVFGSERGLRPVRVFEHGIEGLGTQNRDLVHDSRRVLYVGNQAGVLEFDGEWWRLIPLPNNSAVRSVAADDRGLVAAGGYDEIGVLEPESTGRLAYRSLSMALNEGDRSFGDVWQIHPTRGGFCFLTDTSLFEWHAENGITIVRRWQDGRNDTRSVVTGDGVLFWLRGEGLAWLREGRLKPVPGGDVLAEKPVEAMAASGEEVFIVLHDGTVLRWNGADVSAFSEAALQWAEGAKVTEEAVILRDGRLAMASVRGGVAILDQDGALDELLDRRSGLPDDNVPALTVGPDGALWMGLDGAIVRVGINSPVSVVDARVGLEGAVSALVRHRNTVFVSTTQGVWRLDSERSAEDHRLIHAEPVAGIPGEPWSLASVGPDFFVGLSDGILTVDENRIREVPGTHGLVAYLMQQSIFDENVVWVGLGEGLGRLERDRGWRFSGLVEGVPSNVRSVVEIAPNRLCVGTTFDGAILLTVTAQDDDLRATEMRTLAPGEVDCHLVDDRLLLTAEDGIFAADPATSELRSMSDLDAIIGDDFVFRLAEDSSGRVWLNTQPPKVAVLDDDGGFVLDERPPIEVVGTSVQVLVAEPDGVVWLGTERGLTRVDTLVELPVSSLPAPIIRDVLAGRGDELERLDGAAGPMTVRAGSDRLRFEFAATSYGDGTRYQYRLEPVEDEWSAWSETPFVDFTNLWEGDYRFRVRSMKPGRSPSAEAELAFIVLPPWYRHPAALVMWLALVLAVGAGLVRWRERGLRERSAELEVVVREQTAELAARVRELRLAQTETQTANKKLKEANERLKALSHEDSLTGIANRRRMEEVLTAEWKRGRRAGSPLAVVLLDLDHFKLINDTYGHQAGDDCLREVASALQSSLSRATDLAARFGGEELALVLPNTDLEGAGRVAEEVRQAIENLQPVNGGITLTGSLGAAAVVPAEALSPDDLFAAADRALYDAKRKGRNRVELAVPPVGEDSCDTQD